VTCARPWLPQAPHTPPKEHVESGSDSVYGGAHGL
jgi:hypothetical protein